MTSVAAHTEPASAEPFLTLANIRKVYPGVVALSNFSMSVSPGEVIGLVGENGAGKSTLMKILGGVIAPSQGTITSTASARPSLTVADSMAAGIAFVHQELNLFDNLDVAANVFVGSEPSGGPLRFVDEKKRTRWSSRCSSGSAPTFPRSRRLASLSLAQRQMVEIAKALSLDAQARHSRRTDFDPAAFRDREAAGGDQRR